MKTLNIFLFVLISTLLFVGCNRRDKSAINKSVTNVDKSYMKRHDLSGLSERMAKLTFIYEANQTPAEYIRLHPIVVGNFVYSGETDTHWLGSIHHPRENTSKIDYYIISEVKVKKTTKFKPTSHKYRILILKPSVITDIGKPNTVYKAVGYSIDKHSGRDDGIINLYEELPFIDPIIIQESEKK
jgi:hypothetical protein